MCVNSPHRPGADKIKSVLIRLDIGLRSSTKKTCLLHSLEDYIASIFAVVSILRSQSLAKSRGVVERNDLTGFNWSKVPVILIEMGFMTNPTEDIILNTNEYQGDIVDGIVDGVSSYYTTLES